MYEQGFDEPEEQEEEDPQDESLVGRHCTWDDYPGMAATVVEDNRRGQLVIVWVGDDKRHKVRLDDVTFVERATFCGECGQMGCTHDGRSFDD